MFLFFLCLLCFCARLFICAVWSPAGKGLTSWLSFVVSNCGFVTLPLVSLVRCGTWLFRFLIFAPLLTLLTQIGVWMAPERGVCISKCVCMYVRARPWTPRSQFMFYSPYHKQIIWGDSRKWTGLWGYAMSLNKQSRHWKESSSKQCQGPTTNYKMFQRSLTVWKRTF